MDRPLHEGVLVGLLQDQLHHGEEAVLVAGDRGVEAVGGERRVVIEQGEVVAGQVDAGAAVAAAATGSYSSSGTGRGVGSGVGSGVAWTVACGGSA